MLYLAGGMETLVDDEVDDDPSEGEGAQEVHVHPAQVGHARGDIQHSTTLNRQEVQSAVNAYNE